MQNNSIPTDQPFWVDDANPYSIKSASSPRVRWLENITQGLTLLIRFTWLLALFFSISILPFALLKIQFNFWISLSCTIIGVIIFSVFMAMLYFRLRKSKRPDVASVQARAKELTGADMIGSAIHTAGHPLLQVNQPVVLALKGDELSLYDYKSSTPIDSIRVKDLQSIETVVYDEDRVPHIGVADNTAQALQITFNFRGNPCTCVFRRMYKVRAIEWYQAIQKARLT